MINDIKHYYAHLTPSQKAIARGVGYLGSSFLFGSVTLIAGRVAVQENEPTLYLFEALGLVATAETAKKAWSSFQEGFIRD
jgi:hypothetical protein